MATLIPFPTQHGTDSSFRRRGRHSSFIASAFALASSEQMPGNVDWSLLEHLASAEEDEGDEPRAA